MLKSNANFVNAVYATYFITDFAVMDLLTQSEIFISYLLFIERKHKHITNILFCEMQTTDRTCICLLCGS